MGRTETESTIEELRERVQDIVSRNKNVEDDLYLLRFLKARGMDLRKAESMLRQTILWRKSNGIDSLLIQNLDEELAQRIVFRRGHCKNGAPLSTVDAAIDMRSLLTEFGSEEVHRFVLHNLILDEEACMAWNRDTFERSNSKLLTPNAIDGLVFVLDVKNLSYRQAFSKRNYQFIARFATEYLKYFPVLGSVVIVVNCSRIVTPIINLIKSAFEGPSLSFEVYGTDEKQWKEAILRRVDPDQLPVSLGGTKSVKTGF